MFATEMVAFAFQGARPIRWGIQLKFSEKGTEKSVNDIEIRDVEGILRSARFSSQKVQGYMLITNRRVVQNVVERLRGIDNQTEFHATYIDGYQLSQYLSEQPKLLNEYFSNRFEEIERLASEQAQDRVEQESNEAPPLPLPTVGESSKSEWCGNDLSGRFESDEGILELFHDTINHTVQGRYQYQTEEFSGEFNGEIFGSIIKYEFYWPKHGYSGVGFWFISPDGNRLEGLWFQGVSLEYLTFDDMVTSGHRRSHTRSLSENRHVKGFDTRGIVKSKRLLAFQQSCA